MGSQVRPELAFSLMNNPNVFRRNYHEVDPVILSVGEDQEISIKQAAELVAQEMGFDLDKIKVGRMRQSWYL